GDFTTIKRLFHTIKGNSAAYGLEVVAKRVQLIENHMSKFSSLDSVAFTKIQGYATRVEDDLRQFLNAYRKIFQLNYDGEISQEYRIDNAVIKELHEIAEIAPTNIKEYIENTLEKNKKTPLSMYKSLYASRSQRLAEKFGKKISVKFKGLDIRVNNKIFSGILRNVIHLINNACDHGIEIPEERSMQGKPEEGTLEIIFEHSKICNLRIIVKDDGAGIDAEKLARKAVELGIFKKDEVSRMDKQQLYSLIFMDNVTTKESATDVSGRGIGMSALKKEIDKLNGTIKISTECKVGTQFTIEIPYPDKNLEAPSEKPLILVCEDDESLLKIYKDMLENAGYSVKLCNNGTDGLLEFAKNAYSAIIVDLLMPGMNGMEIIDKFRSQMSDESIVPIIVFSGNVGDKTKSELLAYPMVTVLEKPHGINSILPSLKKVLGARQKSA
ncbi:MAG: response regulator, partial [Oligoflexales bacterium]|nr:response regulator [Oligoflexales bacterium]